MTTQEVLTLARKHLGKGDMESSARFCLAEAIDRANSDQPTYAAYWARRSLEYSVGRGHGDYRKVDAYLRSLKPAESEQVHVGLRRELHA